MAAAESPESFPSASSWGALVVASTLCDSGVSVLKVEITCGLRLSESWKSSFLRLVTICPLASRTTTDQDKIYANTKGWRSVAGGHFGSLVGGSWRGRRRWGGWGWGG